MPLSLFPPNHQEIKVSGKKRMAVLQVCEVLEFVTSIFFGKCASALFRLKKVAQKSHKLFKFDVDE